MYKRTKKILALLIIAALLISTGCSSTTGGKTPSNYSQLYALIGKPVTEVCQTLELDEAAVTSAAKQRESYKIGTIQYAGIDWEVELLLEGKTPALYGFRYTKHYYSGEIGKAAEDTVSLVEKMKKQHGDPGEYGTLGEKTPQQLQEKAAVMAHETARWELADQVNGDMQAYFQNLYADEERENLPENMIYVRDLVYAGNTEMGIYLMLEYKLQFF